VKVKTPPFGPTRPAAPNVVEQDGELFEFQGPGAADMPGPGDWIFAKRPPPPADLPKTWTSARLFPPLEEEKP